MHCSICSDDSASIADRSLSIYACPTCTHWFTVLPIDREERYDQQYFLEHHKNWFANPDFRHFHHILEMLLKYHARSMVDVGCGNGDLLKYVHQRDQTIDLCGIDFIANDYPGVHFIQGDIYTLPVDKQFDALCCLHTIEHVRDPHVFVKILDRLLRPGGTMIISTIDSSSMIHALAKRMRSLGMHTAFDRIFSHHHLQHFTFRSLRKLLESHSFQTIEHYNYNHPLRAVDVPGATSVAYGLQKTFVWILFNIMKLMNRGMLQTIICCKPTNLRQ